MTVGFGVTVKYDQDKVDEVALALLFLTMHKDGPAVRAWKGLDWAVIMTEEGAALAERLFLKHFG